MADYDELVVAFGFTYRAPDAFRSLSAVGFEAVPAVREGLRHPDANVRLHCTRFLDRYLTPETLQDLLSMLHDVDDRVRCQSLHTLACDRCKQGACRPTQEQVLPDALRLLAEDPSAQARAMGCRGRGSVGAHLRRGRQRPHPRGSDRRVERRTEEGNVVCPRRDDPQTDGAHTGPPPAAYCCESSVMAAAEVATTADVT